MGCLQFLWNKSKYKDKQTPFIPRKVRGVLKKLNKFFTDNPGHHDVHKSYLPFNRPYLSKNLASNYKNIIRFLNDGKYDFNVFSDHDFSNNPQTLSSDTFIFVGHSEYWTKEMMGKLKVLITQEKKIIFLSGNTMYREVQLWKDHMVISDNEIDIKVTTALTGAYYTYLNPKSSGYSVVLPNHWVFLNTD